MHADGPRYKTLTLDTEKYQTMLDASDLGQADQREALEALWLLVMGFVDLDYQILFEESCGQPDMPGVAMPDARDKMLCSDTSQTIKSFADAANLPIPPEQAKEAS